jgi:hypothetical protein
VFTFDNSKPVLRAGCGDVGLLGLGPRKWRCRHCPFDEDGTVGPAARYLKLVYTGQLHHMHAPQKYIFNFVRGVSVEGTSNAQVLAESPHKIVFEWERLIMGSAPNGQNASSISTPNLINLTSITKRLPMLITARVHKTPGHPTYFLHYSEQC